MQPEAIREISPLFRAANTGTLETLLLHAVEHEYPANRAVLMEDAWGNAVYFILVGWVKVRRLTSDGAVTIAVLGRGDVFGEMAVLDESPRSTDVVSLSPVKALSVSAAHFVQMLLRDPQMQYRMLQMIGARLKQTNRRFELKDQSQIKRLINTLTDLGRRYGTAIDHAGVEIFNMPFTDLANISDVSVEETAKIMGKLDERGWIRVDSDRQVLQITGFKQLQKMMELS